MQQTSRTAVLDYVLLIRNLIAAQDHLEERIMNLLWELEADPDSQELYEELLTQTRELRQSIYKQRKTIQEQMFQEYEIDEDWRCLFKHLTVALEAFEECRNASHSEASLQAIEEQVVNYRKFYYEFLGIITGVWPAGCGRCLADRLEK